MNNNGFTTKQREELTGILNTVIDKRIEPRFKILEKEVRKINRGNKIVVNYFDHAYLDHDKRIRQIETHLGFQAI